VADSRPLRAALPGLGLLAVVALVADLVAGVVPGASAIVVAVALGAVLGNAVGTPDWAVAGLDRHKLLLETGVVLLGASVSVADLVSSGPTVAGLVVATVACGLVAVELLGRRGFGLGAETSSLLAAGASICGVSAVVAVAGSIDADGERITVVAATVLLFDAVTLVVFPALGEALALPARQFGVWAGLSMFSTGPVAAAGFEHSAAAGRWATLTKLARNALIGVVAVGYSLRYARRRAGETERERAAVRVWHRLPKFLLGFAAVAAVANLGLLDAATRSAVAGTADWLFALAFAGLGFDVRLARMREAGLAPVGVVLAYLVAVSTVTLALVTTLVPA
jgi:uncharacterized integral membrane protein (TIGR00698 family)